MGIFFVYILKSSVCLTIFYLFYKLLLSRDTFHRFNRIALLSLIMLSVIIPFCEITLEKATAIQRPVMDLENLLAAVSMRTSAESASQPVWLRVMVIAYIIGGILTLCQFAYSFYALFRLMRQGTPKLVDGIHLILTDQPVAPFSWMQTIVISRKDFEESGIEIMTHEMAHIKARHSIDLLISEICILFHWFNPSVWLLRQELQNIHEYEADESVLNQGVDAKRYQLLLIKKAVGSQRFTSMANSFNHSSLKKRITMMIRKKSNPWARAKYLYVLPLAAVTMAAFARPEISQPLDEISSVKVNDLSAVMKKDADKNVSTTAEKVTLKMKVVDEKGKPVMGATVLIANTTKGTVTDPDGNFTLEAETDQQLQVAYIGMGTVTLSVADCLKQTDQTIRLTADNTVLQKELKGRVENIQQNESPVVTPTIQIHQGNKDDYNVQVKAEHSPLVILDETEVSTETMEKLNPENIESITVLKDVSATAKYGQKGKYGVILITTRKKMNK